MSEYIVSIIPAKASEEITEELLNRCIDKIIETLYQKILQGLNGFNPQDYLIEDVWNQVEAKRYSRICLVAPTLTGYPSDYRDYLEVVCNICQQDIHHWWADVLQLDSPRQEYFTDKIKHSCPCGKNNVDLTELNYEHNPMYYVNYQIRIWHLFSLLTPDEKQDLIRQLNIITGKQHLLLEGY